MRRFIVFVALALGGCGGSGRQGGPLGDSMAIECVPFARQVSGIQLFGDAASWWEQADGRYERSASPVEGGVLVFRRSSRLPSGHVSVVTRLVSGREVTVTQANWVHHRIGRADQVVDVSPGNDWSRVRVWWAPSRALGSSVYPTYGFIAPGGGARTDLVAGLQGP